MQPPLGPAWHVVQRTMGPVTTWGARVRLRKLLEIRFR
jgi:hypothetical protein